MIICALNDPAVDDTLAEKDAMNTLRKFLAVVAAVFSILFIFLGIRAIGLALSTYHPSTFSDRAAMWLVVAVLFGLSFVLMRFAKRTLG